MGNKRNNLPNKKNPGPKALKLKKIKAEAAAEIADPSDEMTPDDVRGPTVTSDVMELDEFEDPLGDGLGNALEEEIAEIEFDPLGDAANDAFAMDEDAFALDDDAFDLNDDAFDNSIENSFEDPFSDHFDPHFDDPSDINEQQQMDQSTPIDTSEMDVGEIRPSSLGEVRAYVFFFYVFSICYKISCQNFKISPQITLHFFQSIRVVDVELLNKIYNNVHINDENCQSFKFKIQEISNQGLRSFATIECETCGSTANVS